jgi:hypothetical protein
LLAVAGCWVVMQVFTKFSSPIHRALKDRL